MDALQVLEERVASHATHWRQGPLHLVAVDCSSSVGKGGTLDEAVMDLLRKMGLEPKPEPEPQHFTAEEVRRVRDLFETSMQEAKDGLLLARTEPRLKGDVIAGVMTRDSAALAVFIKGDREAWNISRGLRRAAEIRRDRPDLDAAFPLPQEASP